MSGKLGVAGNIARAFIDSKLTPLIIITSVLLGSAAVCHAARARKSRRSKCR